ncbi:MAG: RNA-binding S4 domain-containing protein [Pseudomonadales bacterium]|jgi:ribosome-associated heat shock protein Hsp15
MADDVRMRIDRWLWAARFFRSRALAKAAVESGRVVIVAPDATGADPDAEGTAGQRPKPSRELVIGLRLQIERGGVRQTVVVTGLAEERGNATMAALLYSETPDSIEYRERARAARLMQRAGLVVPAARPDRRERRERLRFKQSADDSLADDDEDQDHVDA